MAELQKLVGFAVATAVANVASVGLDAGQMAVSFAELASDTKSQSLGGHHRGDEPMYLNRQKKHTAFNIQLAL